MTQTDEFLERVLADVNDVLRSLGRQPVTAIAHAIKRDPADENLKWYSRCCPIAQTIGEGAFVTEDEVRITGDDHWETIDNIPHTPVLREFVGLYDQGEFPEFEPCS